VATTLLVLGGTAFVGRAVVAVADTWAWLTALGGAPPLRAGRPAPGLDPGRERAVLAAARRGGYRGRGRGTGGGRRAR